MIMILIMTASLMLILEREAPYRLMIFGLEKRKLHIIYGIQFIIGQLIMDTFSRMQEVRVA